MKIKGWKKRFDPRILERGEDYCIGGMVESLEIENNTVKAIVNGTEDYKVEIAVDGDRIDEMYCDCPYANDGNNCKHMAAVLYSLEADKTTNHKKTAKTPVSDVIKKLPEETLRVLLTELAQKDKAIENKLRLMAPNNDTEAKAIRKSDIKRILRKASGRYGFIDYYKAYGCMCELCDYLDENIATLLEQQAYYSAFDFVCEVFVNAVQTEMDDSDGGLSMLMEKCCDYWRDILSSVNSSEKQKMYRWFAKHSRGVLIDYAEDVAEEIMLNCFNSREYWESNLHIIENKMKTASEYSLPGYVECCMELMGKLNFPQKELEEFRLKYRFLPSIRKAEIACAIQEKKYDEAVTLINESIELDRDKHGLVRGYEETLMDVYEKSGQTALYNQTLYHYISSFRQNDLPYIYKYKNSLPPEKWKDALCELLAMQTIKEIKCKLLLFEKMYRELFEEIKKQNSIFLFCSYDDILKAHFPKETLEFYAVLLNREMGIASSRNQYAQIVTHFKRMKQYPNGNEQIVQLSQNWKQLYPRRTAMLDELDRILK